VINGELPVAGQTKKPPLVVVSTGRATWIAAGIATAAVRGGNFAGPADRTAVKKAPLEPAGRVSPALYIPSRNPPNPPVAPRDRNVYVVVNIAEYAYYKRKLAPSGIIVVGFSFGEAGLSRRNLSMLGFGACRYAAIEFCKRLRNRFIAVHPASSIWTKAWVMDDNVVGVNNFQGLEQVEAQLPANEAAAAFTGASRIDTPAGSQAWAAQQQQANLAAPQPTGLLQQMVLWNIALLDAQGLNIAPMFLTSAEDGSLTNQFRLLNVPYQVYAASTVKKEQTGGEAPPNTGAKQVSAARARLHKTVVALESQVSANPPPPVQVIGKTRENGVLSAASTQQTLGEFVVNTVLPESQIHAEAGNIDKQNVARSQAVEQIIVESMPGGFIPAPTRQTLFQTCVRPFALHPQDVAEHNL
jgi:hypothetical protein